MLVKCDVFHIANLTVLKPILIITLTHGIYILGQFMQFYSESIFTTFTSTPSTL